MSEGLKTTIYVVVAAVLLGGAWLSRAGSSSVDADAELGKKLFPELTKPSQAAALEIVDFDETTGQTRPFRVAQVNGVWSIPSHEGYPADAVQQLGQAATCLIDLEKLDVVSESPADHEVYGVVEPDATKLSKGDSGVGKRVKLEDKSQNVLANLIVGKKDPDRPDIYYVRIAGEDPVYVVKMQPEKLTTKFEDWIETDLLKLNAFDVSKVVINDHSLDLLQGAIIPRGEYVLNFNNKDSKWAVESLKKFEKGSFVEDKLADNEELDAQKLDDLKRALDDLKIVDVAKKPAQLSADLRLGDEQIKLEEFNQVLMPRGFAVAPINGVKEVYSTDGEVRCGLNNGVEYILRFGAVAGRGEENKKPDEKGAADGEPSKDAGVNRFLMVSTRFNKDLIPKPEIKPLPPGSEAAPAEGDKKPGESPTEAKPATDTKPAEQTPAVDKPAETPAKQAEPKTSRFQPGDEQLLALADDTLGPSPRIYELAQAPSEGTKQSEQKAAEAKSEADAKPADKSAEAKPAEKSPAELAAERKLIEAENKRAQEEYDNKVKEGEKKVKELNERFANWYYIIPDSTYQKIHLSRAQLAKQKPAGEGTGATDFEALKNKVPAPPVGPQPQQ